VFFFSVMAQAKQASEEAERLATASAKVGMQMAEKQGRIATLDIECATLKQVRAGNYCFQHLPDSIS
jgi:hypothetical protein